MDKDKRLAWVDILKSIACIGVILIHFTESIPNSPLVKIFTLLPRTSVQIFFLLSGVTLYKYPQISVKYFLKKFIYLVLVLVIFRFIYYIYHQESMSFWNGALRGGYWHLWYIYSIIPIYSISGIIRPPNLTTQKEVYSFVFVIILALILFSTLGSHPFNVYIPGQQGAFSILSALLFILLGYGLNHLPTTRVPYLSIYIVSISLYIIIGKIFSVAYDFAAIYLLIPSICLFLGIKNTVFPMFIEKICSFFAPYTLFIYGFHILWIYIGKFIINNNSSIFNIILYFIFVVIMSFISSFLLFPIFSYLIKYLNHLINKLTI